MANQASKSKSNLASKNSSSGCRDRVVIRGARANNLKNIDIDIPRDKFVVITGLSGSGKSSLAFDTLYAEGNRRYMEGLSSYARNFLDIASKPDVDKIENLSPSISIDQKSVSRSPRSTVGTMTEVYDYLRVLYAKIGKPHCPHCGKGMERRNNREILHEINKFTTNTQVAIMAVLRESLGTHSNAKEAVQHIQQKGFARVYLDGKIMPVGEALLRAGDQADGTVAAVVDRISTVSGKNDEERILDSVETAMKLGGGSMLILVDGADEREFNQDFLCAECGVRIREINPRHFSFNNPEGACPECSGAGVILKINPDLVIPNKSLSLAEGAIQPWSKAERRLDSTGSYLSILKTLAKEHKFSVNAPVKKLSPLQLSIVLYGTDAHDQSVPDAKKSSYAFEGVIPELERKYRETKSEYLRSEIERYMISYTCPLCQGKKLRQEYLSVLVAGQSIDDLVNFDITELKNFFLTFDRTQLGELERTVFDSIAKEVIKHLMSLENVGLEYLNLARSANSISGGEAQRIRLAVQINSQLMGILYVLDEPSIGLHSRDTEKLVHTIRSLQQGGNSLIVVEHDEKIMRSADWIIDMGPSAGLDGGEVVFEGTFEKLMKSKTCTAEYLSGRQKVFSKRSYRKGNGKTLEILGAAENNLKNIDVKLPLGKFVTVCGVSGSGKSTLVADILARALSRHFFGAKAEPGKHAKIKGLEHIDKVISIDQSPIGRTPRSNAATYTGAFSHIRDIFAELEESKSRGYTASRFSFNMKGGRCEVCQGEGQKKIEMHLLPDVYVDCEACEGTGYNKKTLEVEYKGFNIAQVLEMDVSFALRFFAKHPLIAEKLRTMEEVGLGYLKLGQSATNLSGGEAQRIKLSTELARKSTGRTLYILDEPTIGLHFDDVSRLLRVLDMLVEKGNSVLVVEHNLDVVKSSDWVIELGPEGGSRGGDLVFEGTPDKLKKCKQSWTAKYL
ncbi:excinuclease ABC subunit UvrA [Patescibacteria group bacterium]|nr:MAG: excinuclease ABC subunit UvrA [Patescibacteria group bacterium]